MDIVNDLVWRPVLVLLLAGNVAGAVLGLMLMLAPRGLRTPGKSGHDSGLTGWQCAAAGWRMERYVYRHHKIAGALLFAGSVFVLDAFLLRHVRARIQHHVAPDLLHLLDGGVAFLVIVAVLGALLGAIVFFKPSLLKELEASVNRDVVLRNPWRTPTYLKMHAASESAVRRVAGVVLFATSLWIVWTIGVALVHNLWRL